MTKTMTAPHRHTPGEHTESELRYLRPERFQAPEQLDGMKLTGFRPNPHVDRYYDAAGPDKARLRTDGASLRVRVKTTGTVQATFKLKLSDEGRRSRRQETEDAVTCADCARAAADCTCGTCALADNYVGLVNTATSRALDKGRALAAGQPLAYLFSITNARVDYHYHADGAHVVLSEDAITFPDGSTQSRVEVEHVDGDPAQLDRIHTELKALYPALKTVKRGKLSEGRRRLAALLAV